jgi:CRP-like cAMP-binding protein
VKSLSGRARTSRWIDLRDALHLRQDIADLVGTTIETAIRIMSRWQKEGISSTPTRKASGFEIRAR